ncbi:MAG: ADP-forming succinate--CoA ligase subunit beta [Euryarchaeota archaeon]|nr:ADP-forming succinate--CoA ligase subunit beta [Euryarchaeota archaeon]
MKMYEYQGKELLARAGVPVPRGHLASTPAEAAQWTRELGGSGVLKAQVLSGGRGKAGLIRPVASPEEAERVAAELLPKCGRLLVEEKMVIEKELYLSITIDRDNRTPIILAGLEGGIEVEKSRRILKRPFDPLVGLQPFDSRAVAKWMKLPGEPGTQLGAILRSMYSLFSSMDAELVEINPLAIVEGRLVALDAKVTVDDNALFRHKELKPPEELLTPLERRARELGVNYVELEGDIGIVGNGAGLVMSTLDVVAHFGGKPANFCDLGGGTGADTTARAMELVLSNPKVKVLLVNIMAGITRCDEVARGMVSIRDTIRVPTVVRMIGTNEAEGRRVLEAASIAALSSMEEAAQRAVSLLPKGGA